MDHLDLTSAKESRRKKLDFCPTSGEKFGSKNVLTALTLKTYSAVQSASILTREL